MACPICAQPLAAKLADTLLASGEPPARVAVALKDGGVERIGPRRVEVHFMECRGGDVAVARVEGGPRQPKDLAAMVRDSAIEGLEKGELQVTIQHGLQAQQMIENRENKEKDRELMIALARVLGGAVPPPQVIISAVPYAELDSGEHDSAYDPDDLVQV